MSVPHFEPLQTDRLVIRPVRVDDVDALWERRNDPSTAEFQNWTLPYPREKAKELIDGMVALGAKPPPNGWFQLAIDDAATGDTVGDLAFELSFDGRCAEIGWTVGAAGRGRGIATEAAATLSSWLFETVGVSRVSAMTHPDNLASVRVAERIGMVFEGHTRNSYWVGEVNSDDWIYGMTPDDWRAWVDRPRHTPETVDLVPITHANLGDVERLETHRSQRRFVSPVAMSFADAMFPESDGDHAVVPWMSAVEADGEIVGFVMTMERTPDRPSQYLWRLLIDRMHQRRGIGSRALDLVIERARALEVPAIELSYVPGPGSPEPMYTARGFVPTGAIEDGETVARLEL